MSGGNKWYVADKFGNTRALVSDSGSITDYYAYDAWGSPVSAKSSGSSYNPFRWNGSSGYQYVNQTALYHVGAREYDPSVGRWLQRDPIAMSGGWPNLYGYCANDPVTLVDPSGLWTLSPGPSYDELLPYLSAHVAPAADPSNREELQIAEGSDASYLKLSKANHTIRDDEWGKQGASVVVGAFETARDLNPITPFADRDPVGIGLTVGGGVAGKIGGSVGKKLGKIVVGGLKWREAEAQVLNTLIAHGRDARFFKKYVECGDLGRRCPDIGIWEDGKLIAFVEVKSGGAVYQGSAQEAKDLYIHQHYGIPTWVVWR